MKPSERVGSENRLDHLKKDSCDDVNEDNGWIKVGKLKNRKKNESIGHSSNVYRGQGRTTYQGVEQQQRRRRGRGQQQQQRGQHDQHIKRQWQGNVIEPPRSDFFLSRIKKTTDENNLKNFIEDQGIVLMDLKIVSHKNAVYKSYKLSVVVDDTNKNKLLSPNFWPEGIRIVKWKD